MKAGNLGVVTGFMQQCEMMLECMSERFDNGDGLMRKLGSFLLVAVAIVMGSFMQSVSANASDQEKGGILTSDNMDAVVEISDIGVDYSSSMTVGETQTLTPYVLPSDVVVEFTYTTSNDGVAGVDAFGKVTAKSPGTATITICGGNAKKNITITVVPPKEVTSIEVTNFNDKMKKGESQTISPSLYPADADDQHVTYSSSDESVATISSGGTINAVNCGRTRITLAAGAVTKTLDLTVYVPTEKMQVSESYLVMKPGQSHQISVSVVPGDADQNIVYRTLDGGVASVSGNGRITAHTVGEASIVVSNEDTKKVITVIVNERGSTETLSSEEEFKPEDEEGNVDDHALAEKIADTESAKVITVTHDECPYITKDMLKALYNSKKTLRVQADEYIMEICGDKIKNAENELSTMLDVGENSYGLCFVINGGNSLPGAVKIEFLGISAKFRYLYLYDEVSQKYVKLNSYVKNTAEIEREGEYVLTQSAIKTTSLNVYMVMIAIVVVCIVGGTYILIKKRHWFW